MIADYEKVIALNGEPKTPWDYSERGRLFLLAGQAAKRLAYVPAVLDIRGRILEALGKREEAVPDLRRALAQRPDLQDGRQALKRLGADP